MSWALGNMSTAHLRRIKERGKNVIDLFHELRLEKITAEFDLERLQKDHEGLRGGHTRWREEAIMQHKVREVLEAFINKEMKMTAKDPRLKKLARQIAKIPNSSSGQYHKPQCTQPDGTCGCKRSNNEISGGEAVR